MASPRVDRIKSKLESAFAAAEVSVYDDSARHAGHPGAREGAGHFRVRIVSHAFAGRNRLQRHRMVYDALAELLPGDIHALNIEAKTPDDDNPSRTS
jgi:BolA protein